jgi:hypothetical protein
VTAKFRVRSQNEKAFDDKIRTKCELDRTADEALSPDWPDAAVTREVEVRKMQNRRFFGIYTICTINAKELLEVLPTLLTNFRSGREKKKSSRVRENVVQVSQHNYVITSLFRQVGHAASMVVVLLRNTDWERCCSCMHSVKLSCHGEICQKT